MKFLIYGSLYSLDGAFIPVNAAFPYSISWCIGIVVEQSEFI